MRRHTWRHLPVLFHGPCHRRCVDLIVITLGDMPIGRRTTAFMATWCNELWATCVKLWVKTEWKHTGTHKSEGWSVWYCKFPILPSRLYFQTVEVTRLGHCWAALSNLQAVAHWPQSLQHLTSGVNWSALKETLLRPLHSCTAAAGPVPDCGTPFASLPAAWEIRRSKNADGGTQALNSRWRLAKVQTDPSIPGLEQAAWDHSWDSWHI